MHTYIWLCVHVLVCIRTTSISYFRDISSLGIFIEHPDPPYLLRDIILAHTVLKSEVELVLVQMLRVTVGVQVAYPAAEVPAGAVHIHVYELLQLPDVDFAPCVSLCKRLAFKTVGVK